MSAIRCHRENDKIVLYLPTTALFLTEDEAEAVHEQIFGDLFKGLLSEHNGEHASEHVPVASALISRPQAWEVTKCIEHVLSCSDDDVDHRRRETGTLGAEPIEQSLNWMTAGF